MTLRITLSASFAALALGLVGASTAYASAEDVLEDWRADGTIGCDYTLAELRGADAQINPQEREYTFWDEAYADAVRCVTTGKKPPKRAPSVPPQDFDKDGDIDAKDVAVAKKKTRVLQAKLKRCQSANIADRPADCPKGTGPDGGDDDPEKFVAAPSKGDGGDGGDDGGLGALTALLFLIPAGVIGVGAWRMQRARRSGRPDAAEAEPPSSSFAGDDLT